MRTVRWTVLVLLTLAATFGLPALGNATPLPDITVRILPGPTSGGASETTAGVEHVAGHDGQPDTWLLNAVVEVTNDSPVPVKPWQMQLTIGGTTVSGVSGASDNTIQPGHTLKIYAEAPITGTYPLPASGAQVQLDFTNGFNSLVQTFGLVDFTSKVPGGYILPFHDDLRDQALWTVAQGHDEPTGHFQNPAQRYAYDIKAYRYDAASQKWTSRRPTSTNGTNPAAYEAFGASLYAMASGTVIECRFHLANLDVGQVDNDHGAGNSIWIETTPGEVISYGHLKQNSIPTHLCPHESVSSKDAPDGVPSHADPVHVDAGELIGQVGNSGSTTAPHLHVELSANRPFDIDDFKSTTAPGLPLTFRRYQLGGNGDSKTATPPMTTVGNDESEALTRSIWFRPNTPCSFARVDSSHPETYLLNHPSTCLSEHLSDLVRQGYQPVQIDGARIGSNTVYDVIARADQPETITRVDLDPLVLRNFDARLPETYQLVDVDSYLVGSHVKVAGVWQAEHETTSQSEIALSGIAHANRKAELLAAGYYPRSLSAVGTSAGTVYSGIYEKDPRAPKVLVDDVPVSTYQSTFDTRSSSGLRPVSLEGYNVGSPSGTPRIIAVWAPFGTSDYLFKRQLNTSQWTTQWQTEASLSALTRSLSTYQYLLAPNMATLWQGTHVD